MTNHVLKTYVSKQRRFGRVIALALEVMFDLQGCDRQSVVTNVLSACINSSRLHLSLLSLSAIRNEDRMSIR